MSTSQTLALNSIVDLDGADYAVQDANNAWNETLINGSTVRFVVQPGDHWVSDPTTKERAELSGQTVTANGTPIDVAYSFALEPGAANTASTMILGQFHEDQGSASLAPPFTIGLSGEKMTVSIGYVDLNGQYQTRTLFTDSQDIVRGQNYAMNISVTFDPNGVGHLVVTRDGVTIANYTGPLGAPDQSGVYWKEGIYRTDAPETVAADYSNLSVTTGSAAAPASALNSQAASSSPTSLHFDQYNDQGIIVSSTTQYKDGSSLVTTYDNTGAILKTESDAADGSKHIWDYQISGMAYTSDERLYNAAGVLTQFIGRNASGAISYEATYGANGKPTSVQSLNANGSTTINTYDASGALVKTEVDVPGGSKTVSDFGITGQSYISDKLVYNAAGVLTQLVQTHANGSTDTFDYNAKAPSAMLDHVVMDATGHVLSSTYYNADGSVNSTRTLGGDGSVTLGSYTTTGTLLKTETDYADGSKHIWDYQVIGKIYASDERVYSSSGALTQFIAKTASGATLENITYYTDGTINRSIAYNADGSVSTNSYSSGGVLLKAEIDAADGSKHVWDYGVTGQAYVADQRLYSASGALTQFITTSASGVREIIDYATTAGVSHKVDDFVLDASGKTISSMIYNADGTLSSTKVVNADGSTTYGSYSAAGVLTKTEIDAANGSKQIWDYHVSGQTYVSDERIYNTAGLLTQFVTMAANGTTLSNTIYHNDGTLSSSVVHNSDGSLSTNSYSSTGVLIKAETDAANGSKVIYDYQVTGQSYVSDERIYNASGLLATFSTVAANGSREIADYALVAGVSHKIDDTLVNAAGKTISSTIYHADGTLSSTAVVNADGSSTYGTYSAAGLLMKTEIDFANGSKQVWDYHVAGQAYASDERVYNAANVLTQFVTTSTSGATLTSTAYHDDGTLSSSIVHNADGSTLSDVYDVSGHLTKATLSSSAGTDVTDYNVSGQSYVGDERVYNAAGTLTHLTYSYADGTSQTSDFGITGQAYTSDLVKYSANHQVTSLQQFHADGSLSYSQSVGSNGTVTQSFYDATGHLTETQATQVSGAQTIQAFVNNVVMTGGAGNDTITSFGGDTMVFKGSFGNDQVNGFHAGSGANHDVIQLDPSVAPDYAHLAMAQHGSDVVISVDAHNSITLHNVALNALNASNFLFH